MLATADVIPSDAKAKHFFLANRPLWWGSMPVPPFGVAVLTRDGRVTGTRLVQFEP